MKLDLRFLRHPKVLETVHRILPLDPVLSQFNFKLYPRKTIPLRYVLVLSHLYAAALGLISGFYDSDFPIKMPHAFLISLTRVTRPANDVMTAVSCVMS
jgi:hypothetical protein